MSTAKQKWAEAGLHRETAFLEALVDSALEGIVVVDSQGKIILQNPRFIELFHVPKQIIEDGDNEKLLRHAIGQTTKPERLFKIVEHLRDHPDKASREEIELVDGTVLDGCSSPVRDQAGKYYGRIWTCRDLTERQKLQKTLHQAQKMEVIGQLAGGVAHDFNNILAVIQMQTDLLKMGQNLSSEQSDVISEIEKATRHAASLTRQLLQFGRRQALQMRELDVNEVVTGFAKLLQRILGEDVRMQFKSAPQPLLVHADEGMVDQILLNLASNARDAMPSGGRLTIETSAVEFDAITAMQTSLARSGSFACLSVSDTGCGIPSEILPRIFEPFFTTKEVDKGTGLGLATVFGIVQQHQGWINVDSEVGRGTTFQIYLPRLTPTSAKKNSGSLLPSTYGGSETILLVEDDSSVRAMARTVLSGLRYRVLEASSGIEALQVWKGHRRDIQLLVTVLVMPEGMNGKELAQLLQQESPELKVLYTGDYSPGLAGKVRLQKGVNFLTKPFVGSKLAQTVRNCLDQ